jgi:molybdopterin-guanine dinucleotide biosynthesis protein A
LGDFILKRIAKELFPSWKASPKNPYFCSSMEINKEDITGIILAGGRSSRMGKDKGLCDFKGKALVSYAIDTLKPLCGHMMISANHFPEKYAEFELPVIADEIKNIGPMGGIYSCLKKSNTRHNLILSCDTPFVNTAVFQHLLKTLTNEQVLTPAHETFLIEPLSAYYNINVIGNIATAIRNKQFKMMDLFKQVRFKSVNMDETLPFFTDYLFLNLNTPEDLEKANALHDEE